MQNLYGSDYIKIQDFSESGMQRIDCWLPRGWRVGEGWIGSLGLADATGMYRMDKQQAPTM